MIDTVEISEDLLASAMSWLVGPEYFLPSYNRKFEGYRQDAAKRTVDVSKKFLTSLIEEIRSSDPFCDHWVGICCCDTKSALSALELALAGLKYCPKCHGDGDIDYTGPGDDYPEIYKCDDCKGSGVISYANPT